MIDVAEEGDWTVIRLAGDIDLASAPAASEVIAELQAPAGTKLRIDLAEIKFLDSQGLNMLAVAHKRAEEAGGQLELANVPSQVVRLLEITALDELFSIAPSGDAATGESPP